MVFGEKTEKMSGIATLSKHQNIKTSKHQNIKTSKHQNIKTSKTSKTSKHQNIKNIKTSKHQPIDKLGSNSTP